MRPNPCRHQILRQQRVLSWLRLWALASAASLVVTHLALAERTKKTDAPFVILLDSAPATLDPLRATDAVGVRISHQLLHRTLVELDPQLQIAPGVFSAWQVRDGVRYRFSLRSDLRFQDGRPIEAEDAAHTLRAFMDPERGSAYGVVLREKIAQVEVLDAHTLQIVLRAADASFLADLILPLLPREFSGGVPRNGSGRYALAHQKTNEFTLIRTNSTSASDAPVGQSPMLIFKVVRDANTRLLKFRKGDVQLGINVLPADKIAHFRRSSLAERYRVVTSPGLSFQYLGLNVEHAALSKPAVRRALAHAIPVEALIRHRQHNLATKARGLLPEGSRYNDPQVQAIPHDEARARELLDAAGYPEQEGLRLRLSYKTSTDHNAILQARIIQQALRRVGVELDIRSYEWATFYADIKNGDFDLYSLRWIGVSEPAFYYELLHSSRVPPVGRNRGRYANPQMDALLEQARQSTTEVDRVRLYRRIHALSAETLPYLPLWHNHNVALMDRRLEGFSLHPSGSFAGIEQLRWRTTAIPAGAQQRSHAAPLAQR